MILVGIDVAKDKHDCFIMNSDGEILFNRFTILNNRDGFFQLYDKIFSCSDNPKDVKIGLEATGHYSSNLLRFLMQEEFLTYQINPLHTSLYRKSHSLRKTKTDAIDCRTIASMLVTESLEPCIKTPYHCEELKTLTRYRFDKVRERSKLKQSIKRLLHILFPELEKVVSTVHSKAIYALLSEFPSAEEIANVHLTKLTNLLFTASNRHFGRETALEIREMAKSSIGMKSAVRSMELKHTIRLIGEFDQEIEEIETLIEARMDEIESPILTIPGISYRMGAMILGEIGDFSRFSSADKILAYAGMDPSTYQSGQLTSNHAKMVKRGSRYLRYALYNATKYVCLWEPTFAMYLAKKRAEGKHYTVAISHATKKLVRVIYHLIKTNQSFH